MDEIILLAYLRGECSDEEAERVEAWCEEAPENRKVLEQLYYTLFVGDRVAVMNTVDTEASLKNLKSAIREKEEKNQRKGACPLGALCHCGFRFLHRACCCGWNHLGIAVQQTFGLRGADHCRPAGTNGITGWH